MEAAAKGLLFILLASHFPVAVDSFCSPKTAAPAHQLHDAASSSSRSSVLGATVTADNIPPTATPTSTGKDNGGDNRGSSERFENFAEFLVKTQSDICSQAETSDGKATFCSDRWEREGASKVWLLLLLHIWVVRRLGAEVPVAYPGVYADGNVLVVCEGAQRDAVLMFPYCCTCVGQDTTPPCFRSVHDKEDVSTNLYVSGRCRRDGSNAPIVGTVTVFAAK